MTLFVALWGLQYFNAPRWCLKVRMREKATSAALISTSSFKKNSLLELELGYSKLNHSLINIHLQSSHCALRVLLVMKYLVEDTIVSKL